MLALSIKTSSKLLVRGVIIKLAKLDTDGSPKTTLQHVEFAQLFPRGVAKDAVPEQ